MKDIMGFVVYSLLCLLSIYNFGYLISINNNWFFIPLVIAAVFAIIASEYYDNIKED